jgi:hypothetical protein
LFDEHYQQQPRQLQDIDYGAGLLPSLQQAMLVPGKKQVLMLDSSSGYVYDVVNNKFQSAALELPASDAGRWMLPGPGGSVLAVLAWQATPAAAQPPPAAADMPGTSSAGAGQPTAGASTSDSMAAGSSHGNSIRGHPMLDCACSSGSNENSIAPSAGQWVLHAFSLEADASKPLLSEVQEPQLLGELLPVSAAAAFKLCNIGGKTHLVAFECSEGLAAAATAGSWQLQCRSLLLHVTNFAQVDVLKRKGEQPEGDRTSGIRASGSTVNCMLLLLHVDYLHTVFDKFPASSALGYAPDPTKLWVMVSADSSDSASVSSSSSSSIYEGTGLVGGSSMRAASASSGIPAGSSTGRQPYNGGSSSSVCGAVEAYVGRLWNDVQLNTCKPFDGLQITWQALQGWQSAAAVITPGTHLAHPGLGCWVESAMMLVPLQVGRCEGNKLWPMSDGLPLYLDESDTDINDAASKISFGVYDLILSQAAAAGQQQLPVVVVSSMGAQSTGKSYQLNHLAGCFFDVAGGCCAAVLLAYTFFITFAAVDCCELSQKYA